MIEPTWLVLGVGVPALAAFVAVLVGLQPRRANPDAPGMAMGWTLAVTMGALIGLVATFGAPKLVPFDPAALRWQDILFLLALTLGVALLAPGVGKWLAWVAWPIAGAIVLATPWLLVWPIARNEMPPAPELPPGTIGFIGGLPALTAFGPHDPRRWMPLVTVGVLLMVGLTAAANRYRGGRDWAAILGLAAVGAGATIALSGSQTIGQVAISLGAVAAGGGLVALAAPRLVASAGFAAPFVFAYAAALVIGYFYTYDPYGDGDGLSRWHALVLAAAPVLGCLASVPLPKSLDRGWLRAGLRTVLVLVPVAIVVALAARTFTAESAASEADPYATPTLADPPAWRYDSTPPSGQGTGR